MQINQYGLSIIKHFEGLYLKAYKCPAGYLTIGWGHIVRKNEPHTITQSQAEVYLLSDIATVETAVTRLITCPTNPNQFSALASFAFNVGTTALSDSTLLRMHNARNYVGASKQFDRWNKATVNGVKTVLKGLVTRRNAEEALYTNDLDTLATILK